jgi:hypothetical protein
MLPRPAHNVSGHVRKRHLCSSPAHRWLGITGPPCEPFSDCRPSLSRPHLTSDYYRSSPRSGVAKNVTAIVEQGPGCRLIEAGEARGVLRLSLLASVKELPEQFIEGESTAQQIFIPHTIARIVSKHDGWHVSVVSNTPDSNQYSKNIVSNSKE